MSLIYITGIAGSGKSSVQKELKKRGYDAYDVDQPGISAAYDNKTEELVKVPDSDKRPSGWFNDHSWKMMPGAIEKLKEMAKDKPVFLCGVSTANEKEMDQIIYLDIDEATLRHRIGSRENNDFGKTEYELQQILDWYKTSKQSPRESAAIIIDATQPLDKVVDNILISI